MLRNLITTTENYENVSYSLELLDERHYPVVSIQGKIERYGQIINCLTITYFY